ncbi:NADH dehydrogenase ubiquinone Fe-S protein 4 [Wolbachia endosymbiont of Pentidionis agamae]|uniref:NADH dehydrogenase ubiquinone Fe-S protein 4 n=1 Tax=Wolbachia endosymbiont of Pentidionis agamae TaxID=3110435 RepID=UPI002FD40614
MVAKIYQPVKAATQSCVSNTKLWWLKLEQVSSYYFEPLMGWVGSKDPKKQIILKFGSLEKAISHAEKHNIMYTVDRPKMIKRVPKSYTENFLKKNI